MRVLALTFGDAHHASTYYRVTQYIEPLRELGITLDLGQAREFRQWRSLASYDAVLIQKQLLALGRVRQVRREARRLIYEVDDAVWQPHGRRHSWFTRVRTSLRLRAIARAADLCITTNEVLACHLRTYNPNVAILPNALDEKQWLPRSPADSPARVRLGWAGYPVNFIYLAAIENALARVCHRCPEAEVAVLSEAPPRFQSLPCEYIPQTRSANSAVLRTFDIGLLPLPRNPFAEGKSPIKGVQYMACGIPTVVSPIGAARAMFEEGKTGRFAATEDEWADALETLVKQSENRQRMGQAARQTFEGRHALSQTVIRLASLLRGQPPPSGSSGH